MTSLFFLFIGIIFGASATWLVMRKLYGTDQAELRSDTVEHRAQEKQEENEQENEGPVVYRQTSTGEIVPLKKRRRKHHRSSKKRKKKKLKKLMENVIWGIILTIFVICVYMLFTEVEIKDRRNMKKKAYNPAMYVPASLDSGTSLS